MYKFGTSRLTRIAGLVCAGLLVPTFTYAVENTVSVPVQKGEDLMAALKRVHPCFDAPGVKIPAQVFSDNPERVGPGGKMVLAHDSLKLPSAFLDAKTQCGPIQIAEPEGHVARRFRGGPELPPVHVDPVEATETKEAKEPSSGAEKAEAVQAAEHEENESPYKNHVTVLGLLNYSRMAATVNATGAMPIFVSNPEPGFELAYSRDLSPDWSLGFNYMYLNTSFQDIDGLPFTELTSVQQEFAVTARYRLSHSSRISLHLGAAQVDELSISPVDGSLLIDHTFRITGTFIYWQELGKLAGFETVVGLGAQTFVPTDWSQDSVGVGELFRFLFERDLSTRWRIEFGALGAYERQETQSESHSELSIAFGLGLSFRF